jgi:hypothetical protein
MAWHVEVARHLPNPMIPVPRLMSLRAVQLHVRDDCIDYTQERDRERTEAFTLLHDVRMETAGQRGPGPIEVVDGDLPEV